VFDEIFKSKSAFFSLKILKMLNFRKKTQCASYSVRNCRCYQLECVISVVKNGH